MPRTYELGLVIEPRQSDDNVAEIVTKYREMIVALDATITEEDNWGKRKLAYPIRKITEGKYFFFFVSSETAVEWTDIERNIMQSEQILRHLVVRTDLDLKRAATKNKDRKPREPRPDSDDSSDSEFGERDHGDRDFGGRDRGSRDRGFGDRS